MKCHSLENARNNRTISRCSRLTSEEIEVIKKGYDLIAGIDEAGRGPLAGPVVAACVVFPKGFYLDGIDDSKKLSSSKRESVYIEIVSNALSVSVGIVDNQGIDFNNILNATRFAMSEAVRLCTVKPDILLIDAMTLENCIIPQVSLIKGDERSHSIAAASIVAKVTRDKEMMNWHNVFPQYGFDKHKGYGTSEHISNIKMFGLTPIHRKSFCRKFVNGETIE